MTAGDTDPPATVEVKSTAATSEPLPKRASTIPPPLAKAIAHAVEERFHEAGGALDRIWVELRKIQEKLDCIPREDDSPLCVLIVDDDLALGKALNRFLSPMANTIALVAAGGNEAIELLKTHPVDVVLTDVLMPGNGGVLLDHLTKMHPGISVIVMTGLAREQAAELALAHDAFSYLTKPFASISDVQLLVRRAAEYSRRCRRPERLVRK